VRKKYSYTEKIDTRSGFGDALNILGEENDYVIGLCADLTGSLKMNKFKERFPDRFIQTGIAEANMIGIAAGLATGGFIPFAATFANFATSRVYDQIRQVVAYSKKNVKICASHAGLTLGEDGATHQALEDIGLMKMLPHMTVINTCDYNQTMAATMAIAIHEGPVYLRFGRPKVPNFIPKETPFTIGKAIMLNEGNDISIFATGHLVWEAVEAGETLYEMGVNAEIINIHTIKPLDTDTVLSSIEKTKCAVIAEEHMKNGGLGDSIAQVTSENLPVPLEFIAVDDTFGESGKPNELMKKYGLSAQNIVEAAIKAMKRKG
jgi:transketolase